MLRYFGPRYFRAYYFTPNGGGPEQAAARIGAPIAQRPGRFLHPLAELFGFARLKR